MARLLFVSHSGRRSGASNSLLKLLKYLRTEHEVAVVIPFAGGLSSALEQEGIPWYVTRFLYTHIPALVWWIWRRDFDLVYGNNFSAAAYLSLIATKLLRKPFVWHIREVFRDVHAGPAVYRRVRHADAIIAVSEASARSVKRYVPEKDVVVVYNGIETADFTLSRCEAKRYVHGALNVADESIVVISVGSICALKNQLQAVEAAASVIKNHSSVAFCFLGMFHEPDYVAHLKEQAAQLGLENNIHLLGFQNNVATYLRGSDILLHTSVQEAHPRVVLEAMAAELPVVAYDVPGGISETVVPTQTGYLVPFGDIRGISQAIGKLVADPSLRQQMGEYGRKRVETMFTAERTARQVGAVIDRVLHG